MVKIIPALFLLLLICGCTKTPSADDLVNNAIQAIDSNGTIQSFITEADCMGPKGSYKTIIHSGPSGYTYFKQIFSYKDEPFEAVIFKDSAFQIVNDSIDSSLDKETISALKNHEFHMILIDLNTRFHQFSKPEHVSDPIKINALDGLNNPVQIYFKKDSPEIQSIAFENPFDTTERISFSYSEWKIVQGVKLPMHVTIQQGKDKFFTFDFIKVEMNSKDFRRWKK